MSDSRMLIREFVDKIRQAQEADKKGRKRRFLGWISVYIPEEIIIAAGFIPYRVTGTDYPISLSKTYFSGNISSHVLSCLEGALRGEYDFLEGVIIGGETDAMRRLYDTWLHLPKKKIFIGIVDVPKFITPYVKEHYKESVLFLKREIENHFKIKIRDEALSKAITTCQATRDLLNRLNNLRKASTPPITAEDMLNICVLSTSGDKDSFNKELAILVKQLEGHTRRDEISSDSKLRLVMTGSFQDGVDLLRVIEESDAVLVCEDLCNRAGYFRTTVSLKGDPITNIVEGYSAKPPSASVSDAEARANYIAGLVREFNAHGVIYHVLKFDDPYLFEFPDIRRLLKEKDIPLVRIETEAGRISEGQVKTRLQAFIDTLSLKCDI